MIYTEAEPAATSDASPDDITPGSGDELLLGELNRVFRRLGGIQDQLDELLADSRRARPLLDSYLLRAGGWVGIGKGKRSKAK